MLNNNNGPALVCYAVLALCAWGFHTLHRQATLHEQMRLAAAPVPPADDIAFNEAALAALEPAEGPEAAPADPSATAAAGEVSGTATGDGEEGKKSFTGKVLSAEAGAPSITIGMLKVETRKDLKADAERAFTPPELQKSPEIDLLHRRFHFTPYAHDAVRGPAGAPMTMVEFSDFSCVTCMPDLKKADELYQQYGDQTRYIQVYLPVDSRTQTNIAAFYGKVAQRGGKFWEYRAALFDLKEATPDNYFDALIKVGVPAADARRWLTTEARRFYRELDADAQLARALGLDKPPHFFINGIHVGDGGIPRASLGAVMTYEKNYTHYQLDSLGHD